MNKRNVEHRGRFYLAVIALTGALFLALAGCNHTATPSPELPTISPSPELATVSPSPKPTPTPVPLNLLVELSGMVEIKRVEAGWKDYLPASFGMLVRRGDLLKTDAQARANVFCSSISLESIPSNHEGGIPCRGPIEVIKRKGSEIVPLKGENLYLIPHIISPRRTKLMTASPVLKWNPVSGATTYTVIVRGDGLEWKTEVAATETVYPPDAPPLLPGKTYKLIVIGGGYSSEEEKTPDLGFSLLSSKEAEEVRAEEAKIRELALEDVASRFTIGHLYASKELRSEAIAMFESLSAEFEQPAVYRALGDLYLEVRLYSCAQERYAQALELSKGMGDKEGEAAALAGLGLAYYGDRNNSEALKCLQAALAIYEEIGDEEMTRETLEAIAKMD